MLPPTVLFCVWFLFACLLGVCGLPCVVVMFVFFVVALSTCLCFALLSRVAFVRLNLVDFDMRLGKVAALCR